ncbi:efflux RND transporter periplasmic adaptor subunit [Caulobacter sp. 17J65-9]|uniref:HlyD family secretion protein n=1 Tax=Caulobacter sp. 17J65-9 TaxID=2709382 RepID=UPI0013CA2D19|nr:efflux RND transporter periplasmic adaptor subunit [Caulobacter sp. 17J65-9]NEX92175.1 efflux RND transporter periplasmic adaptor subunit [Caulobacter sp. 17J65-9]
MSKKTILILVAIVAVVGAVVAWLVLRKPGLPDGIAGGNGRLEATQVFIATKYPGRIKEVLVNEGDTVEPGQVVARMDTEALEAQLREAEAQIVEAQEGRNVALANIDVKSADYSYAQKQYDRSRGLVPRGAVSEQEAEIDNAHMLASKAELVGAKTQATQAGASIDAAKATADRLRAEIKDAVLIAPLRGRIQSRLAEPGEVLGQGGRVLSMLDLSDVYMYVFLPEQVTGKVAVGTEARIVLDAAPQYPIPATVSFVSPSAQFTPKTVETQEERHALTFRVKLQIDRARLARYEPLIKAGIPGMGYVRYDPSVQWPAKMQPNPNPPKNLFGAQGAGSQGTAAQGTGVPGAGEK